MKHVTWLSLLSASLRFTLCATTIFAGLRDRDQYNRILAVIWDGPMSVKLLMVAMGHAEAYRGVPCHAYCRELEQAGAKAQHDRVGMWMQASYESPAAIRRRLRLSGE